MRRLPWTTAVVATMLSALLLLVAGAINARAFAQEGTGPATDVTVSLSKTEMSVLTGETFTFTSDVTNNGSDTTPALIANLDFVAIDGNTYVDPEDWSSERTVSVDPIPAGSSTTLTWTVKPVLKGDVAVYVVVLPEHPDLASSGPLAASPAIPVFVAEERTLNPGGVLPVVLAVPGVLALAFAGLQVTRRRR